MVIVLKVHPCCYLMIIVINNISTSIQKDWNGGIYATPTMMGSKSGGLIAATWEVYFILGKKNYKKYAVAIQRNVRYIVDFLIRIKY